MELAQIIKTLWDRRIAVGFVVVLAAYLAVATGYKITTSGLQTRSIEFAAADTQLLVDSPKSALADLTQDTAPLATRAAVFAQFMRSIAVKDAISKATGIPADKITSTGPFSDLGSRPALASSAAKPAGPRDYRLVFDSQADLPVISVYAQAPTPKEAVALANGAVRGVRDYVDRLQNQDQLKPEDRVQIRALGPAQGGVVNSGASKLMMAMVFLGVIVAGCVAILGGLSVVGGLNRIRANERATGRKFTDWAEAEPVLTEAGHPEQSDPEHEVSSALRRRVGRV
jgi:hypothetical protein